jgi:transposase-like protein
MFLARKHHSKEERMTAEAKIAQGKMTLLQLAEKLRNVSEACRRRNVSRSQFYEYKRAFQEQGFQGLMDRPPIPRSFPHETPQEVKDKVIALSVSHPAWGRTRISDHLRLGHRGDVVSRCDLYRMSRAMVYPH